MLQALCWVSARTSTAITRSEFCAPCTSWLRLLILPAFGCTTYTLKGGGSPTSSLLPVVQIVAASGIAAGAEVHNTYGELPNAELVHKYGFALPMGNPFDRCAYNVTCADWRDDHRIKIKAPNRQSPSCTCFQSS